MQLYCWRIGNGTDENQLLPTVVFGYFGDNNLMAGIKLYRSNSIEELADIFAKNVKSPLSSPLSPEIVLVQSLGMAKWVNLELAKRLGVWANSKLMFPNKLINSLFSILLPDVDEKLFIEREMLTWMILERLLYLLQADSKSNIDKLDRYFDSLSRASKYDSEEIGNLSHLIDYCKGNNTNLNDHDINFKAFQLARQLAITYDQYLTYRPELIELWEKRVVEYKSDNWQAILWRSIFMGKEFTHKAARRREFLEAINHHNESKNLPERISIFGIPSLPLFHLDILASLSWLVDISFYVMTPAKGYFSDLKSAKQKMKRENIGEYMGITSELLHIETGNPLLASLGRAGADFMESLLDYDNLEDIDCSFIEPTGNTILSMVQKDILFMQDRGAANSSQDDTILKDILKDDKDKQSNKSNENRTIISLKDVKKDRSIVISSCHSPMREVEVLNDYLLELFDSNLDITPADILVMTPDIESYAPFVRAVFTTPEDDRFKIPFSIADLSIKSVSHTVDVFMNILLLPQTRFEVPFIMDILECDDVARRFALESRDIALIREWIKQTAIRWGEDGKYRERIGLPRFEENSWRAGLDRLMAGYAMIGQGEQFLTTTFTDQEVSILPCDSVEGNSSTILGALSRFFNILSSTAEKMASNMSLSQWSDFLMSVTDQLFLPDEESSDMVQEIRDSLNELKRMEELTGFSAPVSSKVIKSWFDQAISKEYHDFNFLNGGVTFCAMLPMRSIPAKVICILGLNDKTFPRIDSSPNFDLIKQKPRRGDRSLRNEDRYLFLETLISAKERLYLSYTGQGIEDNSVIPPSVVISELLDYLDQGFVVNENHPNQDSSVVKSDELLSQADDTVLLKETFLNSKQLSSYIVTNHPLQSFSPLYFEQASSEVSGLFSYSKGNFFAASALRDKKLELKPFISQFDEPYAQKTHKQDIRDIDTQFSSVYSENLSNANPYDLISLSNLLTFFANPQKYFLENTLGIFLKDQGESLDDCEPFNLDSLENYNLKDEMLNCMIKGDSINIEKYRAKGVLPHGAAGLAFFDDTANSVLSFYTKIGRYITKGSSDSIEVDITGSNWRLKGIVSDIWDDKLVRFRIASVKPKDILRAWIIHLAYVSSPKLKIDKTRTLLIGSDKKYYLNIPENSLEILDSLIKLYNYGIKTPLHFFPASSMAFTKTLFDKRDDKKLNSLMDSSLVYRAIKNANSKFIDNYNSRGEGESEEVKLCFKDPLTALDDGFCSISNEVWIPILQHIEETKER